MTWTMYVMEAVGRAKRTGIPVTLHVGKETICYGIARSIVVSCI